MKEKERMRRQREFEELLRRERERQQNLAEEAQRKQRWDAYQDAWKGKFNSHDGSWSTILWPVHSGNREDVHKAQVERLFSACQLGIIGGSETL